MSRGWKPTDLITGEDLILPDNLFEMPNVARRRMIYCMYYYETETGIVVEIQYQPPYGSIEPIESFRVEKFISFASIYCGDVKIYRADKTQVRVERKRKTGWEKESRIIV